MRYKVLLLDDKEHVLAAACIVADNDAEAGHLVQSVRGSLSKEVWRDDRRIWRISSTGYLSPGEQA